MEHAKKMLLVEPKLLESLKPQSNNYTHPRLNIMSKLDENMKNVLENPVSSANEKVVLYNQILGQFRRYLDHELKPNSPGKNTTRVETNHESGTGETSQSYLEEEVLSSVPKSMQRKAKLILKRVKSSPNLSWDERGEVSYKGDKIPGTNILDLVMIFCGIENKNIRSVRTHLQKVYRKQIFHRN